MKKLLIFLMLVLPIVVKADTTANGTGSNVNLGADEGGSGDQLGKNEYFLRSDHYGIRLSFYTEDGQKLGKTVDVYDLRFNWGKNLNTGFDRVYVEDKWARYHGKTLADGSLKSRIDYINEYKNYTGNKKDFFKTETRSGTSYYYYKYYDRGSLGFSAVVDGKTITVKCKNTKCNPEIDSNGNTLDAGRLYKNDPLKYLAFSNRTFFKTYFTTSAVIKRYALLANASIDTTLGNYYILIEPVFYVSSINCDENCGYYSTTELALIYNRENSRTKNFRDFLSNSKRSNLYWKSLRLESQGEIGEYIFTVPTSYPTNDEITGMTFLGKGYGMTIISGKEVDSYIPNSHYQIIYRPIDLSNPFLNIDGTQRKLSSSSNWYNQEKIIDASIYSKAPFLVVTLTPIQIKAIREDNKKINYAEIPKKYASGETFETSQFKKDFGL